MKQSNELQLTVTRQFSASAERVFDAFLDPSKAGQFMFATASGKMVRVEIDPHVQTLSREYVEHLQRIEAGWQAILDHAATVIGS